MYRQNSLKKMQFSSINCNYEFTEILYGYDKNALKHKNVKLIDIRQKC